jgi:probable phosphoglycerate mutase
MAARSNTADSRAFWFVRHGATEPNMRNLRCGGDLDGPLIELGREQARETARRIREMKLDVGMIICSDLQRARETAAIIGEAIGVTAIAVEPLLKERRLGEWNLSPVSQTEELLKRNVTPPGGESEKAFVARISAALERLQPYLSSQPLIVSSKGVARVLNTLLGDGSRLQVANGEIVRFEMQPPVPEMALERIAI